MLRILAFSVNLKPYKSTIDIHILDPRGNLIEQWLEEDTDLGVASKSFYISENPPLGDWTVKVKLHQQLHYQTFTVMEYVLPKFEVLLTTPLHHSIKNEQLEGTVSAEYTYGMPVKGKLTVTLRHTAILRGKRNITKIFEINGSVKFGFSNLELKTTYPNVDKTSIFTGYVDIIVVVTETLTGISQNQTSSVYFIDKEYNIAFYDYPTVLKPMLNFTASLKILRYDGKQLTADERKNIVAITITQSIKLTEEEKTTAKMQNKDYVIPENGIIHIEFPLLADTTKLKIKAEFIGNVDHIFISDVFNSPNKTYIQIKKITQDVKVGTPFDLTINSNIPLQEIHYLVVSRGQIVSVGKENSTTIPLNPETTWTPEACLIVYHVADDGTIINDVAMLSIQPIFKNKISLSWNKAQARPSEKVFLTITVTEPNSLVGLSVVDKSVKLLGDGHEITVNSVLQEINGYSKSYVRQISNPSEVFTRCNIGVLTDANLSHGDDWGMNYDLIVASAEFDIDEMDMTDSYIDYSSSRIRTHFPETWIWKNIKTGSRADFTLETDVPDTITSWVTNAFVISENLGFGILAGPAQLEAFQPFFISLNLPYSVTRGEQFVLEVVIFNYLKEDTEVAVTLYTSDAFQIQLAFTTSMGSQQVVSVPSQEGKNVFFPIRPIQLGKIPITVKAISPLASDAVTQKLLVKAEGIEHSYSQSLLLELINNKPQTISKTLNFTFPPDVVSGSEKASITVVGDILGPSLSSIESLIQMPYGCGEQNMIKLAPNIFIMEYLTNTKQLNEENTLKLVSFMKQGYQRELIYQREDGSFSAFGNNDPSGSTWLSAFVLRCFLRARSFILVDPVVLHKTLTWLLKHQKNNGEFWEPGRVLNTQLQGGHHSRVTLTAYILAALIEYPGLMNSSQMKSATKYLEAQTHEVISNNYTLSLVTYALSLVGRNKAKEGLDILNQRAQREGDLRFWKSNIPKVSDSWQPCSTDIETASYALLSHFSQNRAAEGIAVMKWLSQQRNHLGGYSSTQDTIVALQALSTFASMYTVGKTALRILVDEVHMEHQAYFRINSENRMLLQTKKITVGQPMNFNISAEGFGFALLQLNIIYNLRSSVSSRRRRSAQSQDAFELGVTVHDDKENINILTLSVCTSSMRHMFVWTFLPLESLRSAIHKMLLCPSLITMNQDEEQ
ncbi:hypothetical protein FKM82_011089 [Ascaphus truei]